ncbi:hypothetical protein BgiMline_033556 [Biomphalaria glabrata]|nr:hypothetical protein BgiMline_024647 [Biomphalaria glabrata]
MKNAETERLRLPEVGEYSFVPAAVVIGRCLDQRVAHVFWQKRLRQSDEIALHGVDNVVEGVRFFMSDTLEIPSWDCQEEDGSSLMHYPR